MKEEIKKIILDKSLNQIDKLIKIWVLVCDGKDCLSDLSTALEMSEIVIANWKYSNEMSIKAEDEGIKKEIKINDYIRIFDTIHKEIFHRGFKFTKKEIGQLTYLKKNMTLEVFEKILTMIHNVRKYQLKGKHIPGQWDYILHNFTPTMIYSKINFFLNELTKLDKKSKDKKSDWIKSGAMIFKEEEDNGSNKE